MSLDAVIQRILDKGATERNEIRDAAKREMEKLLKDTKDKGQQDISRKLEEARKEADRLKAQEVARSELESRKTILVAQKEVLDAVRAEVLRRLGSAAVRSELVRTLLDRSKTDWRTGNVYCCPADEKQVRAITGSRFGGTIDCIGGIVIESDDHTKKTDLRIETILQDIWEDSIKGMADLLWP